MIVVDEEHEATYKNGESPRYHAREVAAVRARLEGARLVLGSATPSLESWSEAGPGKRLTLVPLPERVGARPLPPVELVDLRTAPKVPGSGAIPWSEALDGAVSRVLARGEQGMLLLNRRGFAAFLQCPDCGHVPECPSCSISLTVHQSPPALRCHYCAHEAPLTERCAACGHAVAQMRGIGTQQLERWLAERFPSARLARMDLDTTSTKWAHHRILGTVERREVDLLLGTQMIAKGLDFPNVTLVGVVDADTALHLPDFRSAERTFQLIAQVAGRAGRGPAGGRVVVQTRQPTHHALLRAARHDAEGFLGEELALRASPAYPPATGLVNLVVSGRERDGGRPRGRGNGRVGRGARRAARARAHGAGAGALSARADQGPLALARGAQGRGERPRPRGAVRRDPAGRVGRAAGHDRPRSGQLALTARAVQVQAFPQLPTPEGPDDESAERPQGIPPAIAAARWGTASSCWPSAS